MVLSHGTALPTCRKDVLRCDPFDEKMENEKSNQKKKKREERRRRRREKKKKKKKKREEERRRRGRGRGRVFWTSKENKKNNRNKTETKQIPSKRLNNIRHQDKRDGRKREYTNRHTYRYTHRHLDEKTAYIKRFVKEESHRIT